MTKLLIRFFIRNPEDTASANGRQSYGLLASIVGTVLNLSLAVSKLIFGSLSDSLAITADGINNLSDAAGSIVTLITVRLSNKPVDANHPFGHGRMEYLGSLTIGVLIAVMGIDLLRDSISSILHPEMLTINLPVVLVLLASILVKLWLFFFYRKIGQLVQNGTLLAASKDSLSDVLATSAVLLSTLAAWLFGWKIDGWISLLVVFLVLRAGFDVLRETVDRLLGSRPNPETLKAIRTIILRRSEILGVHDLVLHDYGPGRCFASAHAEVSPDSNVLTLHEMIDEVEREIGAELHIPICIHMDPLADTVETTPIKEKLAHFLADYDAKITYHDFRMVPGVNHTNLIFDCVLPASYSETRKKELRIKLNEFIQSIDPKYNAVITFDTDYD